ncbi:MAG: YncE family protein [Actinomycetota bacterium]
MPRLRRTPRAHVAAVVALFALVVAPARAETTRPVVFVANAEAGTVALVDAGTHQTLRTIDVIPDGPAPTLEQDPVNAAAYPLVVAAVGENWAQDLDISPDGTVLYVSRGHRGDTAAFDIASGEMIWRTSIGGFRSDHMTISPDGSRLYVSALTQNIVQVLDTTSGTVVGSFPTGEWPHDNVFSPDGERVYNGSIGNILVPPEIRDVRPSIAPLLPPPYVLTVADPVTLEVIRTIEFDRGIRPFLLSADGGRMYAQISEFHGVVEFDLADGRPLRTLPLPIADGVTSDDYDFEAPHHGLALSGDGRLMCIAGRASDYVALVSTETMSLVATIPVDDAPGWAETSPDGSSCYVASTRANTVSVVSYETLSLVAEIPTDAGPKYLTSAHVPESVL